MAFEVLKGQLCGGGSVTSTEIDGDLRTKINTNDGDQALLSEGEVIAYLSEETEKRATLLNALIQERVGECSRTPLRTPLFSSEAIAYINSVKVTHIETEDRTYGRELPEEAKQLGFKLIKESAEGVDNYYVLQIPSLTTQIFTPTMSGEKPSSSHYFTFSFDKKTNTLQLKTNSGEAVSFRIDTTARTVTSITYDPRSRTSETLTDAYIPDRGALGYISSFINNDLPTYSFDPVSNNLTISRDGESKTIHVNRPEWLGVQIVADKFLILYDKNKVEFRMPTPFFREPLTSPIVMSFGSHDTDDLERTVHMSTVQLPGSDIQTFFENAKENILAYEARSSTATLTFPNGRQLLVYGPNRDHEYLLSSGQSSIYYNPSTQQFRLGKEWSTEFEKSKITDVDLTTGTIRIEDTPDITKPGYGIYEVKLNFDNHGLEKSYTATLVKKHGF